LPPIDSLASNSASRRFTSIPLSFIAVISIFIMIPRSSLFPPFPFFAGQPNFLVNLI
jgi:hypothetical protein